MKDLFHKHRPRLTDSEDRRLWKAISDERKRQERPFWQRHRIPAALGATAVAALLALFYITMSPEERKQLVVENAEKRQRIRKEIQLLAKERDTYLAERVAAAGGAEDSLDHKIFEAVKRQTADLGLSYDAEAPSY